MNIVSTLTDVILVVSRMVIARHSAFRAILLTTVYTCAGGELTDPQEGFLSHSQLPIHHVQAGAAMLAALAAVFAGQSLSIAWKPK